jgi:tripartite-type tricarboxylate transporter receptor subunit TctC
MAPPPTPHPVRDVLPPAIAEARAQPDVTAQPAKLDLFVEAQSGAAAAERLRTQGERYARIIKNTGMKIE